MENEAMMSFVVGLLLTIIVIFGVFVAVLSIIICIGTKKLNKEREGKLRNADEEKKSSDG